MRQLSQIILNVSQAFCGCVNFDLCFIDYTGTAVSQTEPTEVTGKYWGYNVRVADSIANVFDVSADIIVFVKFCVPTLAKPQSAVERVVFAA